MRQSTETEYRSSVYTDRPDYADFDPPAKFQAIESLIIKHLVAHTAAICSYGLTRTGCCGCPISYKAVEDLELIEKYEPKITQAAWAIFGKSYEYRQKYNEYKRERMAQEKELRGQKRLSGW